jgi:hypothetical protein
MSLAVGPKFYTDIYVFDSGPEILEPLQFALTQFEAGRINRKFNDLLEVCENCMTISLLRIEFVQI